MRRIFVKWFKENWLSLFLFFVVVLIIIPFIINMLFKMDFHLEFLVAEWDASSAFQFYGTILGACVTVFGVFLTIKYSRENYKEDVRNRSLPFIVLDTLQIKSHKRTFGYNENSNTNHQEDKDSNIGYREYKIQDYYCILEKGTILYKAELNKSQRELLENCGTKWIRDPLGARCVVVDEICVPFVIENVGNGPAINLRYGLNRLEMAGEDKLFLPTISLKSGSVIMFHVFSEDCGKNSNNLGKYVLEFMYEDIYNNRYEQSFGIEIVYDEDNKVPSCLIDMAHKQKVL